MIEQSYNVVKDVVPKGMFSTGEYKTYLAKGVTLDSALEIIKSEAAIEIKGLGMGYFVYVDLNSPINKRQ